MGLYVSSIAGTVTHEVGHTLGLSHDGMNGVDSYYRGHYVTGASNLRWAPMMGSGYLNQNILRQWNNGDYYNPTTTQDDLAIINQKLAYRADTNGSLNFTDGTASASGIIERTGDSDTFTFTAKEAGTYTFTATAGVEVAGRQYSSLYFSYNIQKADGTSLTSGTASINTLTANFSAELEAGTYSVIITGIGLGNPKAATSFNATGGFSAYGSLGTYTIDGTMTPKKEAPVTPTEPTTPAVPATTVKLAPPQVSVGEVTADSITVNWKQVTYATSYQVQLFDGKSWKITSVGNVTSYTATGLAANTTYKIYLCAFGGENTVASAYSTEKTATTTEASVAAPVTPTEPTTPAVPATKVKLAPPQVSVGEVTADSITVNWNQGNNSTT
jgi:hypothetical protein